MSAAWVAIAALAVLSLLPEADMIRTGLVGYFEHISPIRVPRTHGHSHVTRTGG